MILHTQPYDPTKSPLCSYALTPIIPRTPRCTYKLTLCSYALTPMLLRTHPYAPTHSPYAPTHSPLPAYSLHPGTLASYTLTAIDLRASYAMSGAAIRVWYCNRAWYYAVSGTELAYAGTRAGARGHRQGPPLRNQWPKPSVAFVPGPARNQLRKPSVAVQFVPGMQSFSISLRSVFYTHATSTASRGTWGSEQSSARSTESSHVGGSQLRGACLPAYPSGTDSGGSQQS
eukprot:825427-Rhodomonas_salina.1